MAYGPLNARSELVWPRNWVDAFVSESTRRFHTASAASNIPALRPTRGSGIGAPGSYTLPWEEHVVWAHAEIPTKQSTAAHRRAAQRSTDGGRTAPRPRERP